MKKVTTLLIWILISFASVNAQPFDNGIGVHFTGIDFYGPQTGHYFFTDKMNAMSSKNERKLLWDPSIRLSYWHTFSKHIDFNAGANVAALQYPMTKKDSNYILTKSGKTTIKNQMPFIAIDAKAIYNIFTKDQYMLTPYVTAGLSGSIRENKFGFDIPLGIGASLDLGKGIFLTVESDYYARISKNNLNHLTHSIGMVYWWKSHKSDQKPEVKLPELPLVKDTDNDGIPDTEDACPLKPGKRDMKGCPDKDGDAIADDDDICPDVKGLKIYNGCPDTDGDGISDNKDNCPTVAGTLKYQGCPIPDTDQDGFNDEVDKCPTVASMVNQGCPEVKAEDKKEVDIAAQGIFFETNSAVIKSASFKNLDKIVEILNLKPTYKVDIEGHTDNSGSSESNLVLSQQRADACKQYLKDKGISDARINSKGYGDTRPTSDNATAEGRAKNRRTEFKIKSY